MIEKHEQLANAPIVEAVIDIDCDMPPTLDIDELEEQALDLLRESYPTFRKKLMSEHRIDMKSGASSEISSRRETQAIMFLHDDEKQLVQIRRQGYSFNRLAPYSNLDDYIPEIQQTWESFLEIASPVQIRSICLRYINRICIPFSDSLELNDYLKIGPHLPDEEGFTFTGFLNQHNAIETVTGNQVNIVLTSQKTEDNTLPIILDITAARVESLDPRQWDSVFSTIQSLRKLKNQVFFGTLTEQCLALFQ